MQQDERTEQKVSTCIWEVTKNRTGVCIFCPPPPAFFGKQLKNLKYKSTVGHATVKMFYYLTATLVYNRYKISMLS